MLDRISAVSASVTIQRDFDLAELTSLLCVLSGQVPPDAPTLGATLH